MRAELLSDADLDDQIRLHAQMMERGAATLEALLDEQQRRDRVIFMPTGRAASYMADWRAARAEAAQ